MDSHSWDKLTMHASHIENKDSNLTLNSFFAISKSAILLKKKKNQKNTDSFYNQKNTDLYLLKI